MANFLSGRKTKLDLGITSVTEADVTLDVVGIVTANQFNGNQVIGTPTIGSFRAGAYTPVNTEFTKDSIDAVSYTHLTLPTKA